MDLSAPGPRDPPDEQEAQDGDQVQHPELHATTQREASVLVHCPERDLGIAVDAGIDLEGEATAGAVVESPVYDRVV